MNLIDQLKETARDVLYRWGALGLYHQFRNRRALTVLMFHRVLPVNDPAWTSAEREFTFSREGFGFVLDFIKRHYNVVTLRQLHQATHGGDALPSCPVLITFDDGWRDTVYQALPELLARSIPAVLFATTDAMSEAGEHRWWQDALVAAMTREGARSRLCEAAGWSEESGSDRNFEQRAAAWLANMAPQQRHQMIERVAPGEWDAVQGRQMMTLDDLKIWQSAGFEVGGHGCSHAPLSLSANSFDELERSQSWVAEKANGVVSMSFPHGALNHELVDAARRVGFELIFTSKPVLVGWDSRSVFPETLGRIHLPENGWTCEGGKISEARLATYLFPRPVGRVSRSPIT